MLDTYIKIFADQKNLVSLIQYKKISLNPFSYFFSTIFFLYDSGAHCNIFLDRVSRLWHIRNITFRFTMLSTLLRKLGYHICVLELSGWRF